jgi:U2 small nuclear ribonucleoprotein A'
MPEITPELIRRSPQIVNPLRERELVLRGQQITQLPTDPALWGAIVRDFDCVNLCDNRIQFVDAFFAASAVTDAVDSAVAPAASSSSSNASRVTTLMLHNNPVTGFSRAFARTVAQSLRSLLLHRSALSELVQLDAVLPLLPRLERLSLTGSPVCALPHYRAYVIARCPRLKLLDGERVRLAEREAAAAAVAGARQGRRAAAREARRRTRDEDGTTVVGDEQQQLPATVGAAGIPTSTSALQDAAAVVGVPASGRMTAAAKAARRAELHARMEAATTVEEMDAIEAELRDLE